MGKLFLASIVSETSGELMKIIEGSPNKLTVAFIPTAADTYENKSFIDVDRDKLVELGFNVINVDLKNRKANQLRKDLEKVDIVFVAGGNSFYLLEKVLESGFDKIIKELVERGVTYVGSSAGAILAGPSIEPVKTLDDPSEAQKLRILNHLRH
jgi:dipeptidase E